MFLRSSESAKLYNNDGINYWVAPRRGSINVLVVMGGGGVG